MKTNTKTLVYRWHLILSEIADKTDENSVGDWFGQTDVVSFENNILIVKRPNRYPRLEIERTVMELLKEAAASVFWSHIHVILCYEQDSDGKQTYTFG